jgi:NADH-quinone oxidoreductase subunit F
MSSTFSHVAPGFTPSLSARFHRHDGYRLEVYRQDGGYAGLEQALDMEPEAVIEQVKQSNLRGRGGAGFPTGMKWGFIPKDSPKPKVLVVNADESEPGTFKDRYVLARDPHSLIEGAVIAAYAIGAHEIYIYVRGEFFLSTHRIQAAVSEAYDAGILGPRVCGRDFRMDCVVHRGAGAYICGEETALLESLEGKPGKPRLKPPFPAISGAFGRPTIVNNVETLACVPLIFRHGVEWFLAQGSPKNGGPKLVCVSGHVERPGVYEVPNGFPCDALLELCGGVWHGHKLKAIIPGGSSSPVLAPVPCRALARPEDESNPELWPLETQVPLDFDHLKKVGSMLGSAGVIVLDETACMVGALSTLADFYSHESCGQCSPCREGSGWVAKILRRLEHGRGSVEDYQVLRQAAESMMGATICPLADALAMPVLSYIQKFPHEFEAHLHGGCSSASHPWVPTEQTQWEDVS